MKIQNLLLIGLLTIGLFACNDSGNQETTDDPEKDIIENETKTVAEDEPSEPAEPEEGWKIFKKDNYSIHYPEDWKPTDKTINAMTQFSINSKLSSEKDIFQENVNLTTQDLKGATVNIKEVAGTTIEQVKTMLEDASLISNNTLTVKGKEVQEIIYIASQQSFKLKFRQRFFVQDGTVYILTFTSEQSEYDNYKETVTKMMDSFVAK